MNMNSTAKLRRLFLVTVLASLSACSVVPKTEMIHPVRAPITEIDVLVLIGAFQQPGSPMGIRPFMGPRQEALNRLIPALLTKNGMAVQEYRQPLEWDYRNALTNMAERGNPDRYLLMIDTDKYIVRDHVERSVLFEVRLFDRKIRRAVWKATVQYNIDDKKFNAPAEVFTRDLLLALAKDKLVNLPNESPIDLKGQEIKFSRSWEDDR